LGPATEGGGALGLLGGAAPGGDVGEVQRQSVGVGPGEHLEPRVERRRVVGLHGLRDAGVDRGAVGGLELVADRVGEGLPDHPAHQLAAGAAEQLLGGGVEAGAPLPARRVPELRRLPLAHVVGHLVHPLDEQLHPAVLARHRDDDVGPPALDRAPGDRVGDVVPLHERGVELVCLEHAAERPDQPRLPGLVDRVGRRGEHLEDGSAHQLLARPAHHVQVRGGGVHDHQVRRHHQVRRRQSREQPFVVPVPWSHGVPSSRPRWGLSATRWCPTDALPSP
jgi:hypothetical protein